LALFATADELVVAEMTTDASTEAMTDAKMDAKMDVMMDVTTYVTSDVTADVVVMISGGCVLAKWCVGSQLLHHS
jgi:hypothetical protein